MNNSATKTLKNISLNTLLIVFCTTCFSTTSVAMENVKPLSTSETTTDESTVLKVVCRLAPQLCL